MVKTLILICVGVFVASILIFNTRDPGLANFFLTTFGLVPAYVTTQFFVWQLVTYIFLHGGFWHIFFNMLMLWMFGCALESYWGSREFLKFFLLTGAGGGVASILMNPFSQTVTIGASGAIFGILMAYWLLFPNQYVLIWFLVPIKVKYFVPALGLLNLYGAYQAYTSNNPLADNVAYLAHFGGALVAYLYLKGWLSLAQLRQSYYRWKIRRMRSRFEVYEGQRDKKTRREDDFWIN